MKKKDGIRRRLEVEFHRALALEGQEREDFIQDLERGDPAFATALRRLIALDERASEEVDRPLGKSPSPPSGERKKEALPLRVGRYQIRGILGRGGMGIIYEASQENPHRTIALKLLRREFLHPEAQRRFQREAEILARLPHEGIAHIYEAGVGEVTWPGGQTCEQPFLAMELIHGLPLGDFCKAHELSWKARLGLLVRVCVAVDQAHQQGIIHRDLKPQNILVTEQGIPKVLDFGVARFLHMENESLSLQTHTGQVLGTLTYMSPEQVRGENHLLSPRSDVYSLGVIGFELLTGTLPLPLQGLSLPQAAFSIQEDPPSRLGTYLPALRGDLETIFQTALEKEPSRRYPSAGALGADLERFLSDEPIRARPPSRLYRIQKFTQRHRGLVYGTTATIIVLILGILGTTTFALRARAKEIQAREALGRARSEARKTEQIQSFLNGMLTASDPNLRRGKPLTVVELVDKAAREMDEAPPEEPEVEAALRVTLGDTYRSLSRYPRSVLQLKKALLLFERTFGDLHPKTAEARLKYTRVLVETQKLKEADSQLPLCVEAFEAQGKQGRSGLVQALLFRSQIFTERHRFDEAAALAQKALGIAQNLPGDPILLADCLSQVAFIRVWQGKYEGTEDLYLKAYRLRKSTGRHLSLALQTLVNLASLYMTQGYHEKAENLYTQVLGQTRKNLGKTHQMIPPILFRLGVLRVQEGRSNEAIQDFEQCIQIEKGVRGGNSDLVAIAQGKLGRIFQKKGEVRKAVRAFEAAAAILEKSQGGNRDTLLASIAENLGELFLQQGELEKAYSFAKKAYRLSTGNQAHDRNRTRKAADLLSRVLKQKNLKGQ